MNKFNLIYEAIGNLSNKMTEVQNALNNKITNECNKNASNTYDISNATFDLAFSIDELANAIEELGEVVAEMKGA